MPDYILDRDGCYTRCIYLDLVTFHDMFPSSVFSLATIRKRKADVGVWDSASRKLKPKEVKSLSQGHTDCWHNWDWSWVSWVMAKSFFPLG